MALTAALLMILAQPSATSFEEFARRCTPAADPVLLARIVSAESAFRPNALSIDYPLGTARLLGYPAGSRAFLAHQPDSPEEAARWIVILINSGFSVGVGLMQISSRDPQRAIAALDPCWNLSAGWNIFLQKYRDAIAVTPDRNLALRRAIAAYNGSADAAGPYVRSVLTKR